MELSEPTIIKHTITQKDVELTCITEELDMNIPEIFKHHVQLFKKKCYRQHKILMYI